MRTQIGRFGKATERPTVDQAAVLTKAVTRAAERLGMTNANLAQVLGVSEPSVSRMKSGRYVLGLEKKEGELGILFVRLFRGLDAILGGDENAERSWLKAENTALGDRPIKLIQTITGLINVVEYVDSRRARI